VPLRGETIGAAYVRILADGGGFSDDVKRQMRDAEPQFREAGGNHGREYQKGFAREMNKAQNPTQRLEKALERGSGRWNAIGETFSKKLMKGLRDDLEKRFPDVGRQIFRNLKSEIEGGKLDFPGLERRLRNIQLDVGRATGEVTKEQVRQFDDLSRAVERWSKTSGRSRTERKRLIADMSSLVEHMSPAARGTEAFRGRVNELTNLLTSRRSRSAGPNFSGGISKIGDVVGKAFGKGSRNDLLNFFGSFISLGPRAIAALAGITDKALGLAGGFMTAGEEGVGAFSKIGGSIAAIGVDGFIGLGVSIAAVLAIIPILIGTLGVLASALVLVSGLVLALAGAIGFALVGGIVAVGGALLPFAAALGVASLAMTNMDKKSKFFKTLKKDWTDLQSTVQKDIFGKQLQNLSVFSSIIKSLHPVIDSVARALGGLLVQLGKATQANAFKTMMKNFGDALGPMVTTIGHIAGNLGTFLIRAFIIATPYIQRFLDWLDRVTRKWVEFTKGGKQGSKSGFAKFLDKAVTSAEHLWGLLKEVGLTLLDLLGGGKATGDNVLVKMQGWVHNIRVWLEDPKNKKTIEQWWKDAETLGDKLGRVVTLVAQFVGNLDNPQSRKNLDDILTSLGDIIIKVDQAIPVVQSYITNIGAFFQPVNDAIKSLNVEFDKIDARAKEKTAKNQAQPQGFDRIFKGGPIQAVTDFVNFMNSKWPGVHESFMRNIGDPVANFFTTTLPQGLGNLGGEGSAWQALGSGFQTYVAGPVGNFFTTTLPTWFSGLGGAGSAWSALGTGFQTNVVTPLSTFFTSTLPTWFSGLGGQGSAWQAIGTGFQTHVAGPIGNFFTTTLPAWLSGLGGAGSAWSQLSAGASGAVSGISAAFSGLSGKVRTAMGDLGVQFLGWLSSLPGKASGAAARVVSAFTGLGLKVITAMGNLGIQFLGWVSSLRGRASTAANQVVSAFTGLGLKMIHAAGNIGFQFLGWVSGLPSRARGIAGQIASAFSGLATRMIHAAGSIVSSFASWASGVYGRARGVADDIVSAFFGLAGRIVDAIGTIIPRIQMPTIARPVVDAIVKVAGSAEGMITTGPQLRLIGEAGPEAVVPLRRPLNQVDPAVRMLSAIAQGKAPGLAGGGVSPGRTIDVGGITIHTPAEDPRAVASEVVAHMAAASYF
jgi:hypothetical protein